MATLERFVESTTKIDENGQSTTVTVEKTKKREKFDEPDYIKIYTNMWCEFNAIPVAYRPLFLELVSRMSYCNAATQQDLQHSQLVSTGKPFGAAICAAMGWKSRDSLQKGLKVLCACNAIRQVARGVYQINPSYAGKGQWRYNPTLGQGGIEELVATFHFKNKKVETNIIWADDGQTTDLNENYREGLGVNASQETVLKKQTIKDKEDAK